MSTAEQSGASPAQLLAAIQAVTEWAGPNLTRAVADAMRLAKEADSNIALRDYFAAKALAGMLAMEANPRYGSTVEPFMGQDDAVAWIAKASYQLADAMLAERAK